MLRLARLMGTDMEMLKGAGALALGLCVIVALMLVAMLVVSGIGFVSAKVLPWLLDVSWIAFAICLFILLPFSLLRITRKFSCIGFMISSFAFGLCGWMLGFLVTYSLWGFIGVAIGLFIAGIGVVPIGIVAAIINGTWDPVWEMLILVALTFGTRIFAAYLGGKIDQDDYRQSMLEIQ